MPERTFTIVAVQDGKSPLYMDNQNISYSVMWGLGSAELLSQLSFVVEGFLKMRPGLLCQEKGTEYNASGNAFRLPKEDCAETAISFKLWHFRGSST